MANKFYSIVPEFGHITAGFFQQIFEFGHVELKLLLFVLGDVNRHPHKTQLSKSFVVHHFVAQTRRLELEITNIDLDNLCSSESRNLCNRMSYPEKTQRR